MDFDANDEDGEPSFEKTMLFMKIAQEQIHNAGRLVFFFDPRFESQDGRGRPSFGVMRDTTFGFSFDHDS